MRGLGALLILWGAGGCFLLRRRRELLPLRLGEALLEDLSVLRAQICRLRRPLPELLDGPLRRGGGAQALWLPLLRLLLRSGGELPLEVCWRQALADLPPPLDLLLAPLGPLLAEGGPALSAAIDETREELTGFLRKERERQALAGRLTAAVCLSGACLLILVLM